MGLGAMVHKSKTKLMKDTNGDIFKHIPGKSEDHRSMTSYFNAIKKHGYGTHKQGKI